MFPKVLIAGTGHFVPAIEKTNGAMESELGLSPGWIEKRTGFSARRYVSGGQATSDLAIGAGRAALENSKIPASKIGALVLATSTPDYLLPATAPFVASQLSLSCGAMDVMNACSGFLNGLILGQSLVQTSHQAVLLIAANVLSKRVNKKDKKTAGIFADGAGAIVLARDSEVENPEFGCVTSTHWVSRGDRWADILIKEGGSRNPLGADTDLEVGIKMEMNRGQEIFRLAAESMKECSQKVMEQQNLSSSDIDHLVLHQASKRIVLETAKQLRIPEEKAAWWLGRYGNSSAATLPIAIDLGKKSGKFLPGQKVLLAAAGAGMTAAAAIVEL